MSSSLIGGAIKGRVGRAVQGDGLKSVKYFGDVPEWMIGTVSKTVIQPSWIRGSNPLVSAKYGRTDPVPSAQGQGKICLLVFSRKVTKLP